MANNERRLAFTLIELLVVIAIIAILIALLVPAVQRVRESAARLQCENKLKQVALALHNYHDTFKRLPPPRGDYGADQNVIPIYGGYAGWMYSILPYVEQGALYQMMQPYTPSYAAFFAHYGAPVGTYQCPSDPRDLTNVQAGNGGLTSYLGVTGGGDNINDQMFGPTSGIFQVSGKGLALTDITDGTSNTLMLGERPPASDLMAGWWADMDYDNFLPVDCRFTILSYTGCLFPGVYGSGNLNDPCGGDSNHFWSFHPGGGNWALGDGTVRFLSYTAQPLMIPLATRAGGEAVEIP